MATTNPKTIDEYLASVSPDKRAALERLRKTIHAAVPDEPLPAALVRKLLKARIAQINS
jgi:hypothetical protein